jgi:hypothetical protein
VICAKCCTQSVLALPANAKSCSFVPVCCWHLPNVTFSERPHVQANEAAAGTGTSTCFGLRGLFLGGRRTVPCAPMSRNFPLLSPELSIGPSSGAWQLNAKTWHLRARLWICLPLGNRYDASEMHDYATAADCLRGLRGTFRHAANIGRSALPD